MWTLTNKPGSTAAVTAGVPADYAPMLRWLTGAIIAGDGADPDRRCRNRSSVGLRRAFGRLCQRHASVWTW